MIYFDVTKTDSARHRSGLVRVGRRLREELGESIRPVYWKDGFCDSSGHRKIEFTVHDWLLTQELFCEEERPGFWNFIRDEKCRKAAVFHDAIPLKLPKITWSQSVQRHPEYMKMLAGFDRVFAVSEASGCDLTGFWQWQGADVRAQVDTILWGANFSNVSRVTAARPADGELEFLCVGILEPRKNQTFLLDVCEALWSEGMTFRLNVVGRVNDQFGGPVHAHVKNMEKSRSGLRYHEAATDEVLTGLYARASATIFPTLAEGCGLPLLESLWMGRPCLCSDLPVLRENAQGGGCCLVPANNAEAWKQALRKFIADPAARAELTAQTVARELPTWKQAAEKLKLALT